MPQMNISSVGGGGSGDMDIRMALMTAWHTHICRHVNGGAPTYFRLARISL